MLASDSFNFVSYLAPNLFWFYQAIGAFWQRSLSVPVNVVSGQCDPLHDPLLLQDQMAGAFICGLPFARYSQAVPSRLQAILAPVMQASRYQNRPVYFSDVIVSSTSSIKSFEQLAGKTFCYNDSGSNSGYNLLRYRLMQEQYPSTFFGQVLQSGSHQQSIRWVAAGKADCAAIDSTVLEQEFRHVPQLEQQLQVIESIGPSPMPPIVVAQRLGKEWIDRLQTALLRPDTELQVQMHQAGVQRFVTAQSASYTVLAQMYDRAMQFGYKIAEQNL